VWQLYAVQIGIGIASAACLYEAAFAVIIAWHTPRKRPGALLALTVVAGFASTIFLPLTGRLVEQHGWRTSLLVLAAIQGLLTVPLHAIVLRPPPSERALDPRHRPRTPVRLGAVIADRGYWLLGLAFTANTAAVAVVTVHLVAALVSWGHPATLAATMAGLSGILSVTGRLVTTGLQRRLGTIPVVTGIFAIQGFAAAALALTGRHTAAAAIAVIGFGLGFGVAAIAKPVLLAERYDTRRYATIAATLVVPITVARATAPLGAARLHTTSDSYRGVFLGVAATCLLAAVSLAVVPRPRTEGSSPGPART
jgi:MFS family permease